MNLREKSELPSNIAAIGLIEGEKDPIKKKELEEQFWKPLLELAIKIGYIPKNTFLNFEYIK